MVGKTEITRFQLIFLLIHAHLGVGAIILPYKVFVEAKADSWISVLLTGITVQLVIFIFGALMMRFPSNNLYGIVQIIFGKWIGKVIILLYCMYFIFTAAIVMSKFVYILKVWMLPLTPKWVLVALMMMIAVYIVKENLQIMARFFVISSIVLIGFIGLAVYALKDANITYILPVGNAGVLPVIKGMVPSLYSFQGFEVLLLIYPFVLSDHKGVLKAATITNVFITLFYTSIVTICLLFFSAGELRLVSEPVLYLIKSFNFAIIERPDLLFTSMWIVLVATTIMISLYTSSLGLSVLMNSNKVIYILIVAAIIIILSMNMNGGYEIASISKAFDPIIIIFGIVLPIIFLLISLIFNKKEGGNNV